MKELSLHILDITRNSIKASSTIIEITVEEDEENNIIRIIIKDNGKGMDEEILGKVTSPFFTTRDVRSVGLGIPLLKAAAERCNGYFKINSIKDKGTTIECAFEKKHIDRAPLGNMGDTIMTIVGSLNNSELIYSHKSNVKNFVFDTRKIREILEDVDISSTEVLLWIREYINDNLKNISNSK